MIDDVDHLEGMRSRVPLYLKNAENLDMVLQALCTQYQGMESMFQDMLNLRAIDTATGAQLDGLGQILDLARVVGQTDDVYRIALKGRVLSFTKSGEVESIIATYIEITQSPTAEYTEIYPATIILSSIPGVDIDDPDVVEFINNRMSTVKAAGVSMVLSYQGGFTFSQESQVDGDGNGPTDSERGFGSSISGEEGGGGLSGLAGSVIIPQVELTGSRIIGSYGLNQVGTG